MRRDIFVIWMEVVSKIVLGIVGWDGAVSFVECRRIVSGIGVGSSGYRWTDGGVDLPRVAITVLVLRGR